MMKVFDRISWESLLEVMRWFGFNDHVLLLIWNLLNNCWFQFWLMVLLVVFLILVEACDKEIPFPQPSLLSHKNFYLDCHDGGWLFLIFQDPQRLFSHLHLSFTYGILIFTRGSKNQWRLLGISFLIMSKSRVSMWTLRKAPTLSQKKLPFHRFLSSNACLVFLEGTCISHILDVHYLEKKRGRYISGLW